MKCYFWWCLQYTRSCRVNLNAHLKGCAKKNCDGEDIHCPMYSLKIFPRNLKRDVEEYLQWIDDKEQKLLGGECE